ncbi:MAG TPA: acyl-CoA thioester hydrolase/BAAT C-terminal domain-containing protein [Lapillicoccus sp.]|uniref:acyl-CoA thioester hydrolase/BAAT C-terminal domain-containing protein n=1 Tax=Lapillicoccus sp. TaxID=1909287 RepID=UPI002F948583
METCDKGLEWLRTQPEVDPARVWVMGGHGGSYGSEAALLEASRRPDLVHGVIAVSPSNSVTVSFPANGRSPWTVGGQDVPFTALFGNPDPADNPAALIPVETVGGPVLAVGGETDTLWPSCPYANAIMSRLDAKGFAHPHEVYAYPQAGH